jgi:hypothetical protein
MLSLDFIGPMPLIRWLRENPVCDKNQSYTKYALIRDS